MKKPNERITACIRIHEPLSRAIDTRVELTGETRSRIIEQALIMSGLLELPAGTTAGMGNCKRGRPRRS